MNEPEGNVGDQSLAMPKSKTQPKQTKFEWLITCCDKSELTANNDESQRFSWNLQVSKLQTLDIQIGCALRCMDLANLWKSLFSANTNAKTQIPVYRDSWKTLYQTINVDSFLMSLEGD